MEADELRQQLALLQETESKTPPPSDNGQSNTRHSTHKTGENEDEEGSLSTKRTRKTRKEESSSRVSNERLKFLGSQIDDMKRMMTTRSPKPPQPSDTTVILTLRSFGGFQAH